jgi:hypothetical protein
MHEFYELAHTCQEPIRPRDALAGGRTNALCLYYKVPKKRPDLTMRYLNVCSLYPYVCKYMKYPLAHPSAPIVGKNIDPKCEYFGLIKCKVLSPQGLFLPVLPMRIAGKLFFTFCYTCAKNKCVSPCPHNDDERCLEGGWTTCELYAALKEGYLVKAYYEVWQYPNTSQYDPVSGTGGLFASFINAYLKISAATQRTASRQSNGRPTCTNIESEKESVSILCKSR